MPVNAGTSTSSLHHTRLRVVTAQRSGSSEQLEQPLPGGVVVCSAGRLDHQLDRERDHVHGPAARFGDLQVERERRRGRVAHGARAEHGELGIRLRRRSAAAVHAEVLHAHEGLPAASFAASARRSSKNLVTACSTPVPPEIPSQLALIAPVNP